MGTAAHLPGLKTAPREMNRSYTNHHNIQELESKARATDPESGLPCHAMASETSLGPLENPLCFCLPCQQGEMIVLLFHKMDWTVNYYKNWTPKIRIKIVKKYEKYAKPLNRTTRASQAEADEKLFSETRKGIIKFSLEREIINTVNKTSLGEKAANRQMKIKVLIRPQTTLKNTWARHKVLHVNLLMPPESPKAQSRQIQSFLQHSLQQADLSSKNEVGNSFLCHV